MQRFLTGALFCTLCASAQAIPLLELSPLQQSVTLGSTASIELRISGLDEATALSAFDVQIVFDPTVLAYDHSAFGDQLDLFGLGDVRGVESEYGVLNVWEISLDGAADLLGGQADAFTLATLSFQAVGEGFSALTLSLNALADADGNGLPAQLGEAGVTVSAVPLPAFGYSLALALAGLPLAGRRRRLSR
ncbi:MULTISPECIES: cohesin domain-containing protein [Methylomonas]|uniref:cohesin domain-containing protein n=1 Tax=Methylomonas TaxID=416 RepID=UPI00123276CF|nr:cohesin domain-containing protein [Methylomonas rhizoryzae]